MYPAEKINTGGERFNEELIRMQRESQFLMQKISYLERAAAKLDTAKFFLQILWEIKALDNNKYIGLSEKLNEVGRMLGGWMRQTSH